MPSDANGIYSLPDGYLAIGGVTIQPSQHNPPLEDLAAAMSARIPRSGTAPMTGALKLVDGVVGGPGVAFASAPNTGLYKTANGIGVAVAGAMVAEFTSGGVSQPIGILLDYTGSTPPGKFVFPYGQTLSRATFADLWLFAQTEIAAGNIFYNNGDGSTTFGIGDLRARTTIGLNNMGGGDSGRLAGVPANTGNSFTIGGTYGAGLKTLGNADLPVTNLTFTGINDPVSVTSPNQVPQNINTRLFTTGDTAGYYPGSGGQNFLTSGGTFTPRGSISSFGGGGSFSLLQPSIVVPKILYAGA